MTEKQKLIIQAAQAVLIRDGGSQFSARKVATEAGMSLGNLQYHYKTKFDLLAGVLDAHLTLYQQDFERFAEQPTTGWEGLVQFIKLVFDAEGSSDDGKLFQALALHLGEPGMHTKLTEFFETIHRLAQQCLDIIVENRCTQAELQQAANLMVIYTEGYDLLQPYIHNDKDAAAQQLTTLLGHLLRLNSNS